MRTFFFLLIILPFWTFSQTDPVFIQFNEDKDSFPDCAIYYSVNGDYLINRIPKPKYTFSNFTYIDPAQQVSGGKMRINSVREFQQDFPTFEKPLVYYKEYSIEEIDSLVKLEKYEYYWLAKDDLIRRMKLLELRTELTWIESDSNEEPEDTIDWSKELNGGPINVPTDGVIYGVYIPEILTYLESKDYFEVHPEQKDSLLRHYELIRKERVQPKLDSILRPFYISRSEITNAEYREFVHYVMDSIALHHVYDQVDDDKDANELLNLTKTQRKKVDRFDRKENLKLYGLKKPKEFYSDPRYVPYLTWLYYPQAERYYKRREINFRQLKYCLNDSVKVSVYPDTSQFSNLNSETFEIHGQFYFWHPAHDNYPVVNLRYEQMLAFCHWKEHQLNKKRKIDEPYIEVDLPTITQYEMAMKSISTSKNEVFDRDNSHFTTYERDLSNPETVYLQRSTLNLNGGNIMANETYNNWFRSVSDEQFIFYNGNVSEAVRDQVDSEFIKDYQIANQIEKKDFYCTLGGNYQLGVMALGDNQKNAAFFKRLVIKDKPDPFTGFRVVYQLK